MLTVMGPRTYSSTLRARRDLVADVGYYTLDLPEPMPLHAGQFVMLHCPKPDGSVAKRAYSVVNAPATGATTVEHLELCVKHLPGGTASTMLAASAPGDTVELSGPFGHFGLQPLLPGNRRLFVATGTGVAPFMAMVRQAVERGERGANVLLGFRHEADVYLVDELEALLGPGSVRVTLSQPGDAWVGLRGRVTAHLEELLPDATRTDVYLCGNPSMVEDARHALDALGVPHERTFFEKFTSPGKAHAH